MAYLSHATRVIVLLAFLTACGTTQSSHQNFLNIMNGQVGRSIDERSGWRSVDGRVSSKVLPNGNIEEGYTQRGVCRYFFEISQTTRKIVSWRYEGTKDECIVPP